MHDVVEALEAAANMIHDTASEERRRLIVAGMEAAAAERSLLRLRGKVLPFEPGFMSDMPTLAEMAGRDDALEVIVSAGMLMLAWEVTRLRSLHQIDPV